MKPDELRKLKRDTRWPGWKGGTSADPLRQYFTVTARYDEISGAVIWYSGFDLLVDSWIDIAGGFGLFTGAGRVISSSYDHSYALTAFDVDSSGNSVGVDASTIDWRELFIDVGAASDGLVNMNPQYNLPVDQALQRTHESVFNRVMLVGYPILEPYNVAYSDGANMHGGYSTTSSAPATVYSQNAAGSGNGHCNPVSGLMDNYCACVNLLQHLSPLGFGMEFDEEARPIAQPIINVFAASNPIGDDNQGILLATPNTKFPTEKVAPAWFDLDVNANDGYYTSNDNLKHTNVYFDPSLGTIYGIAWYIFDVIDWWYNIVNNGWAAPFAATDVFPLLLTANSDSGGGYISNAEYLKIASYVTSTINGLVHASVYSPLQNILYEAYWRNRTFTLLTDSTSFISASSDIPSIGQLGVADPEVEDCYLESEKQ